jgi:hypothetical protein
MTTVSLFDGNCGGFPHSIYFSIVKGLNVIKEKEKNS